MNKSLHYAFRQVTGEYQDGGDHAGVGHVLFQGNACGNTQRNVKPVPSR